MKKLTIPVLFIGTLVMITVMAKTGASLKTSTTPKGILNLEFAYDTVKTNTILNAWAATPAVNNIEAAKNNTYYDFLFLSFYALFLFFICKKIAQLNHSKIGLLIANGALAAGVLDIAENLGMLATLSNHSSNTIALFTTFFAAVKWVLAIIAVLYVLVGVVSLIMQKKLNQLMA
ncbi:MAG: hypothetical protein IPP48_15395 [Chitinophagaceae bacterium]|nr:hypothetical protein [Chitinophagaceae bacterium]